MLSGCLCLAFLLPGIDVQATLLDGQQHTGVLTRVDSQGAELELSDGTSLHLPASELQQLSLVAGSPAGGIHQVPLVVGLTDGSSLIAREFTADGTRASLTTAHGNLSIPLNQLRYVRFSPLEPGQLAAWNDLLDRETRNDLLVILKDNVLDFVGGVVGEIGTEQIGVIVNDRDLELPRARVFGIIYSRRTPPQQPVVCAVDLLTGEHWRATALDWDEGEIQVSLPGGQKLRLPLNQIHHLDFGLGKIRYLSDLGEADLAATYQPVGIQSVDQPLTFPIRVNRRLILGSDQQPFDRSVWVHSGTTLRLRTNREYRRLEMTVGMVQSRFTPQLQPRVRLIVQSDGSSLFDRVIAWDDPAELIQLDIEQSRVLEIRVLQVEPTLGSCEHLGLGEARLVK